jgi:multicomponent Na+:H+ antiporter subunit G
VSGVEAVRELLSWALIVSGGVFCVIGGIGVLRMPEFYARMHAAGVTDTLGAALVLIGLMLQPADWTVTVKLAVILVFLFSTSPTAAHALIHAAHGNGQPLELAPDAETPEDVEPR